MCFFSQVFLVTRILHQVQLLITWKMLDISLMIDHFS
ncbi:hypothetical protein I3760_14G079500 [Carya illinoinensis]|nr:hypothetical protein I3760_14G079500 [Carya illinoinensis]